MWAVERRGDDVLVGACGLFPHTDRLELGYIIDHRYRRQGYAVEAARAAVACAQAVRPGRRIYATIRPENEWSLRVAGAVGLVRTGSVADEHGELLVYDL
jgi:RimJ/RimL family protein N-acetyltransferase